jgi:23S rRNA pseudouridine2605 synthase
MVLEALTMSNEETPEGERLNKVLSRAGVTSRRHAEIMMSRGRVSVNGEVVTEMGHRVNPDTDIVSVDGSVVSLHTDALYVMLHKPQGVVSTMSDDRGRPDLGTYEKMIGQRVYNVGRLDQDTTGLLLMTNDGEVANRVSHPSFEVEKVYTAAVQGDVEPRALQALLSGVELEDGLQKADKARMLGTPHAGISLVEITLHSGKNRIVRRMLDAVGHPVKDLHRRRYGPLHLGGLAPGVWRELTKVETAQLLTLAYRDQALQERKR